MTRRSGARSALAAVLSLSATACGAGDALPTLQVYAASSLTEAFGELERLFEPRHAAVDVALVLAGSQILRVQIEHGAPADVFASANPVHMQGLVDAGLVREPRVFAHNELVVVVPEENPAGIEAFGELTHASRLVLGTPSVPVGAYAREALAKAEALEGAGFAEAVLSRVVSEEANVRLVLAKVELGEADAAIVYRTDAAVFERLRTIPIPSEANVRASYSIGVVEGGGSAEWARAWVELVLSEEGQALLARHGFPPVR